MNTGAATGTITVWAMGAEGENLPELAKEFEQANPGVKVNVTPSRGTPRTTSSRPRSPPTRPRTSPWSAPPGWASSRASARSTRPRQIDKSGFFEGAQKTTEVDGTSYGIPWYVETRLVFYRTDLAKKAGITSPPTDWDGLKSMAKAMQDKAGAKWGIGLQAGGTGSWQSIMPFAWSAGADLTKDGGKAYNFDSPGDAQGGEVLPVATSPMGSPTRRPPPPRRPSPTSPAARCRCSSPARG